MPRPAMVSDAKVVSYKRRVKPCPATGPRYRIGLATALHFLALGRRR
jgi:hypothetical protein